MENAVQNQAGQTKMPTYIGTKIVRATPMSKENFEAAKNNSEVKEGYTPGYMVIYEDGYKSWSPKDVFERCYRMITAKEIKLVF